MANTEPGAGMTNSRKEALVHTIIDIAFDLLASLVIGIIVLAGVWVGSWILEVIT